MSLSFSGHRLNTARAVTAGRRMNGVSAAATEARRRWGRATWFGIFTYLAWSPFTTVNKLLPAGSSTRGVVLTIIPLIGAVAVARLPSRGQRKLADVVVGLLATLVVLQAISVEQSAGATYLLHVIPGAALLLLAASARSQVTEMSLTDIRFAVTGVLPPVCCLLLLGWIVQLAHLVPVPSSAGSAIAFSIEGNRLQGLSSAADPLGFVTALVTIIAFVAKPGKLSWFTRAVGILTILATDSRTAMILLGVGLVMLWVFGPGRRLTERVIALLLLIIVGIGTWRGVVDIRRSANTDVLTGRDNIWHDLVPYLHHVPIIGYGPNFFPQLVPLVLGPNALNQVLDAQNQWLSDSLEFGFVAAAVLTLFLIALPIYGSSTYRRALLLPLLVMVLVDCFSQVPLALFSSIDGAFPLFLLVLFAPLRGRVHVGAIHTPCAARAQLSLKADQSGVEPNLSLASRVESPTVGNNGNSRDSAF
jgi:disulfide bond formation protein DsbB